MDFSWRRGRRKRIACIMGASLIASRMCCRRWPGRMTAKFWASLPSVRDCLSRRRLTALACFINGRRSSTPRPGPRRPGRPPETFQALKQYVCDVFPVSGPLGRACRVCPPAFWEDVLEFVRGTTRGPFELLTVEESWSARRNQDAAISTEKRAEMKTASQLAWPCFKTVLLLAVSRPFGSGDELLSGVREISGIDRLLDFLERRFFDRSRLIRSSTVLCRAARISDTARGRLRNRLDDLSIDRKLAQQALDEIGGNAAYQNRERSSRRLEDARKEHEQLSGLLRDLDEQTVAVRQSFEFFERDCRAVQYLDDHADQFQPDEVVEILALLGAYDVDAPRGFPMPRLRTGESTRFTIASTTG